MKAAAIRVGRQPEIIEIDGSLKSMQAVVGGFIEPFNVLFGEEPCLFVNEEGLFGCEPNRAVYATKEMQEQGYYSQITGLPVAEGELNSILFGDILAVSSSVDEYGEYIERDITDEEFMKLREVFKDETSGIREVFKVKRRS